MYVMRCNDSDVNVINVTIKNGEEGNKYMFI